MALPDPLGKQYDVVYLPAAGHVVVLGVAGTGKTVMAIHRAAHLADRRTDGHGKTLLLTFNRTLAAYLRHLASGTSTAGVTVETYGKFVRGYLDSRGLMKYNDIADASTRMWLIDRSVLAVKGRYKPHTFFARDTDFFADELEWIDAMGLRDWDGYEKAKRIGRMEALTVDLRRVVWDVRTEYRSQLHATGKPYDWKMLPAATLDALRADSTERRYRHIIVDEAQDLPPEAIRSLAAAIPDGGSLTLFADYAQQVYGQRISWRSCDLTIRKQEIFTDNYRNSPQIAALAEAMSDMPHFKDSADLVPAAAPQRAAGPKPTLLKVVDAAEQNRQIARAAAEYGKHSRVGVLARTRAEATAAVAGVTGVTFFHDDLPQFEIRPGVYAGTYHSAKGLEFDVVLLPGCSASRLPDADVAAAFGVDEASSRESRLLYVAVTRARDELVIAYSDSLTTLLPPASSALYDKT